MDVVRGRVAVMRAAVRAAVVAVALVLGACSHGSSSAPAAQADYPTLPPESSTPIGLLIDQASALTLSSDQVAQLRKVDGDLRAKNDVIDGEISDLDRPAHAAAESAGGDTAMQGQPSNSMMHNGQQHFSSSDHPKRGTRPENQIGESHPEQERALREQEKSNTQAAVAQALQLLDAQQQLKARALLSAHGFGPPAPPAELKGAEGALPAPSAGSDEGSGEGSGEP